MEKFVHEGATCWSRSKKEIEISLVHETDSEGVENGGQKEKVEEQREQGTITVDESDNEKVDEALMAVKRFADGQPV